MPRPSQRRRFEPCWHARPAEGLLLLPQLYWTEPLFVGGYNFETPPPEVSATGAITVNPPTGARTLNARASFFFSATYVTPAMCMRLPDIGSQYVAAFVDSKGEYFDGSKTYKVTLPKDIPAGEVLVVHRLRQSEPLDARHPAALSPRRQPELSNAGRHGERRRLDDRLLRADQARGVSEGNWIQTDPKKGWFVVLRLYSPLEPFFDEGLAAERDRVGEVSSAIEQPKNTLWRPIMKTEYSRRSVLAVGALALIDTTMTGRAKAQTPDAA